MMNSTVGIIVSPKLFSFSIFVVGFHALTRCLTPLQTLLVGDVLNYYNEKTKSVWDPVQVVCPSIDSRKSHKKIQEFI